ncbi:MAG: DMT family transporter [Ignavibacterium sp.]|nr:DMT family transporter [Ignavibacterium sp.]MDW8376139.1 DMT family transporter [Ignavibacteriales bacterium]
MLSNKKNPQILSAFYVSFAASLWAFDGIVFRPFLYNLPVPLVVFIESTIVTIVLAPVIIRYRSDIIKLNLIDWISFILVAVFGGAVGTMAITKALFYVNYVNLSIVVFIQKLQPVFAISLAAILLKEKLSKTFVIWSTTAIIGAYIVAFGFNFPLIGGSEKTFEATLFALIAAFSFGASTVFSKRALKNVSFELGTYLRFSITSIIMLIVVLISSSYNSIFDISGSQVIVFFLIAFSTGGPAILVYYYGLKNLNASVATICELMFPLTAVILEYFVHDKILSLAQWFGAILLIVSILKVSGINFYLSKKQNH